MNNGSKAAELIRRTDWTSHPLGLPEGWPGALKVALGIVLNSPESMFVAWGPDLSFFCNDACLPNLGPHRVDRAMGAPLAELWADAWDQVSPIVVKALAGEASRFEDLPITLARHGEPEQTWWTFSYSPLFDEGEAIAGMFCVANEQTARVTGEERLRESEGRNRQIVDSAIDHAIIATDSDGRVTRWSEGARHILGWTEQEMLGEPADRFFTPEDVAAGRVETEMRCALETGAGKDERWHIRKSGERFWADGEMTVLRNAAGAAAGFVKVLRDRTEARLADEARRLVEGRLVSALGVAQLGTFDWNPDTGAVELDARGREIFGLPELGDVTQDDIFTRIDPEEFGGVLNAAQTAIADAAPLEIDYSILLPGGMRRHVVSTSQIVVDPHSRTKRVFGVFADITERQRLETELRQLNEKLAIDVTLRTAERDRMWETSPDLLLAIDFDGVFRRVNPAWTTILGYASDELVDHHVNEFVVSDDHNETTDAYQLAAEGGRPAIENRYRHKDGSIRWISWAAARAGNVTYATGRDVTRDKEAALALRQAEEQLRQSQKVEAVGQLTGGVAHDFNNLLTVIRGSIDLIRRPGMSEEKRTRYINAIADTTDRAAKLTSQLLAFARRQTLKPTVFDARKSVTNLHDMLGTLTGSRIEIAIVTPDEPCPINADPSQFDTALVNMAVNARDAMSGSGKLTVSVRAAHGMPAVRTHPAVEGEFIAVSLTDTGDGILPEQIDQIFEPFFTTKSVGQGTGLGLSQVFGFAKQSGGEVTVESDPGKGATFTLYLPRATTVHNDAEAESDGGAVPLGQGACVLVVEDNAEVGEFATEALQELGYDTRLAIDGQQALAMLSEQQGGFDVVFSDVVMPGMSGIELGQEIRRGHPDLPVILASGYSTVLAQNGTHGFELLQKPYSVDELSRVLRKAASWREKARQNGPQGVG